MLGTPIHRGYRSGCALVLLLGGLSCTRDAAETATLLPDEIHGLPLVESQTGEQAAGMIGRLHEADVAVPESHVGYYGPEEMRTTLYVSRYASEEVAATQVAAMADRIRGGAGSFGHHAQSTVGGTTVHSVFGQGQAHYFYAAGTDVTWLAVPPMLARPSLAQLLGVPIDSVPQAGPRMEVP